VFVRGIFTHAEYERGNWETMSVQVTPAIDPKEYGRLLNRERQFAMNTSCRPGARLEKLDRRDENLTPVLAPE
jgi:hypothetical protein